VRDLNPHNKSCLDLGPRDLVRGGASHEAYLRDRQSCFGIGTIRHVYIVAWARKRLVRDGSCHDILHVHKPTLSRARGEM
jgi:hypothetical protein